MGQFFRIRVVLVYRRYFEWLPSRYNQEWKMDSADKRKVIKWPITEGGQLTPPFSTFYQWERNGTYVNQTVSSDVYFTNRLDHETGEITHPTLEMKKTLEKQSVDVTVLNYHTENLLAHFFCDGVPMANASCEHAKQQTQQVRNPSSNEMAYDMVATAAHKEGLLKEGCSRRNAKLSIRRHQEEVLNLTASDFPLVCWSADMLEEFRQLSYEMELALQPSIASDHDEAFKKAVSKKKFCAVDAEKVLQEEGWRSFFSSNKCACKRLC
jgi:hypothetical protein